MELLLLILLSGGSVILTSFLAYIMITSGIKSIGTKTAIGFIADKTGVNKGMVESYVNKKPFASDPGISGGNNINSIAEVAKGGRVIASLASKIPGPIGAVAGAAMIGLGATAAVTEAVTKTGLRAISENATKIANGAKLHFTRSKADRLLNARGSQFNNGINLEKKGITDSENGENGVANDINKGIRGAKFIGNTRDNIVNGLSDTWGNRELIRRGKEIIAASTRARRGGNVRVSGPSMDPLLGEFTGKQPETREKIAELSNLSNSELVQQNIEKKYKNETLKEFIKAKKDSNQKVMGGFYAKEYAEAKNVIENEDDSRVSMLKQRMMLDVVKSTSRDMKKDELLKVTNDMYNSYIDKQGETLRQAEKAAEEKNEKVALETVESFFGKNGGKNNKGVRTELTKKLDEYINENYKPKNAEERTKLREETWEEIANDLNGVAAKAVLTDDERTKIRNKIESNSKDNIQKELAKIENKPVQEYRTNNPDATLTEARREVEKQNNEQYYKKALEEALANVELQVNSNNNSTTLQNTQQIVQQTTVNQTIEQANGQANIQQQQIVQNIVQNNSETSVTQKEEETGKVYVDAPHRETRANDNVIQKESNNIRGAQKERINLDSQDIEQIASKAAVQAANKANSSINKSMEIAQEYILGKLGSVEEGIEQLNKAMDELNNGSIANLSKPMEKMFKNLGNGNVEFGAKYLEKAVRNLEEGKDNPIFGDSDKNELVYAIAELMKKEKKSNGASTNINQIAG